MVELKTTRGADGSMTTHTPERPQQSGVTALLEDVLRRRIAQGSGGAPRRPAGGIDRAYSRQSAPQAQTYSAPMLRAAPSQQTQAPITRIREMPQQPGAVQAQWAGSAPRPNSGKIERYLGDGHWEFDGIYPSMIPSAGGFQNGAVPRPSSRPPVRLGAINDAR